MSRRARPQPGRGFRAVRFAAAATLVAGGAALVPVATPIPAAAQAAQECDVDNPRKYTDEIPAFDALGIEDAWAYSTGAGVTVAVVDSGVVAANDHFDGALTEGVNVVRENDSANNAVDPHGTAAAGIIAARPIPDSSVVGVAPGASISSVRVFYAETDQARDENVHPTAGRLAEGIAWAAQSGAQIINVSISTTNDTDELREAVQEAQAAGALVVASAGNRASATNTENVPRYPAAYDGVLGVSAVDVAGLWIPEASFASEFVDVAAPGQHVPTAFLGADDCVFEAGDGLPSSSWATAYVSGAAALVAAKYPEESADQWAYRLEVTATRASTGDRDEQVGWGIVRPVAALQFVDDGSARGPDSPVYGPAVVEEQPRPELDLVSHPDPMAPAKLVTRWALVAGVVLSTLALLTGRLRQSAGPAGRRT